MRRPQQKYDTLFRELQTQSMQHSESRSGNDDNSANDAMKNELKRYLMELDNQYRHYHHYQTTFNR